MARMEAESGAERGAGVLAGVGAVLGCWEAELGRQPALLRWSAGVSPL
jgi:hypothetical protein